MESKIKEIAKLTEEQFLKMATNAVLVDYPTYSVLKITKTAEKVITPYGSTVIELTINVRVEKPTGQKVTKKITVYQFEDGNNKVSPHANKTWTEYTVDEMLALELVNPVYDIDPKEVKANIEREKAEKAALKVKQANEREQKEIVKQIEWEITYGKIKTKPRTPKQLKSSFKKFSADNMEEAKLFLTEEGVELLEQIQEELALPVIVRNNSKSVLKSINNKLVLEICEKFEKTFEEEAEDFKYAVREFLLRDEDDKKFYEKYPHRLEATINNILESNKFKLFMQIRSRLHDLDIQAIEMETFDIAARGFEGKWNIILNGGQEKSFFARAIIVDGGYVRTHYRYISSLTNK
jgi:hypothetical protein